MGRLNKLPEETIEAEDEERAQAAPTVDIAQNPEGGRVVTLNIPDYVEVTDEERAEAEHRKGSVALARCDATGKLIHKEKNVNEIQNAEREEFNGLVLSTEVLKPLMEALNRSRNNG